MFKIVSDSSSNVFSIPDVPYATTPLKINANGKEYIDTPQLDLPGMLADLRAFKGRSGSSCPNTGEWLDAFAGAQQVFGVTISKNLSGSYSAAMEAARQFTEEDPTRKVHIFDSMSAGPELAMLIDKLRSLIAEKLDFETVRKRAQEYHDRLHTLFCLRSLTNLARNGRVSPAVAKLAGVLGIRVVGAAENGQLAPAHKPRGEKKALQALLNMMQERGLENGSLVRIAHCYTPDSANALKELVQESFPLCRFIVEPTTALCSYYAEEGGLIIGFEGSFNAANCTAEA